MPGDAVRRRWWARHQSATHHFPSDAQTDHSAAVWHICIWSLLLFLHPQPCEKIQVLCKCLIFMHICFFTLFLIWLHAICIPAEQAVFCSAPSLWGHGVHVFFFFLHNKALPFIFLLDLFIFMFAPLALMCAATTPADAATTCECDHWRRRVKMSASPPPSPPPPPPSSRLLHHTRRGLRAHYSVPQPGSGSKLIRLRRESWPWAAQQTHLFKYSCI